MDCQKHLFTLPGGHHYLNCAFLSPLLKSVEKASRRGLRSKHEPWEVTPEQFFENSNRLRNLFAKLVNVTNPERIAIHPAVSYGMATVARNLPVNGRKKIVTVGEQFPSNVYPWMRLCRERNLHLDIVEAPKSRKNRGKKWNRDILNHIDEDTLMVAIGNVHWTDGTLFDLEIIGQKARETGALFAIDGTQSVGALPFDVQKIRPDALVCAGYKWLMGPYSMAMGYFGEAFDDGIPLEEGWIARKNSEDFAGLVDYQEEYQPGAIRYDVGERSNFTLVPMMNAALEQILEWGPANIQQYARELTAEMTERLAQYGYEIEEPDRRSHHLFGIYLGDNIDARALQQKLTAQNVHVSLRGSAVRISVNIFNNEKDIEALEEVLKAMI